MALASVVPSSTYRPGLTIRETSARFQRKGALGSARPGLPGAVKIITDDRSLRGRHRAKEGEAEDWVSCAILGEILGREKDTGYKLRKSEELTDLESSRISISFHYDNRPPG